MAGKTPGLDFAIQMAVRDLLKLAFGFVGGTSWDEFSKVFNEGATEKYNVSVLEEMSRTKTVKGVERPKKIISHRFAVRLITFCRTEPGLIVPAELAERLGVLWGSPDRPAKRTKTPDEPGGFIPALGLTDDVAVRSIRRFNGEYLHFALNEDEMIVTTRCTLSEERGADAAPVFRSKRWYSEFGPVEAVGVYFSWDTNLYLLASPAGEVDLRLSIFNVLSSSSAKSKQHVLRGMALGVNPKKTILSSRCVLVQAECVEPEIANQLWDDPAAVESFKNIKPGAGSPDTKFRAIAEYLCGEETVDYIKLIKLTAPG
jgi:hypothetical protein